MQALICTILLLAITIAPANAAELTLNFGGGPQLGSDSTGSNNSQINYTAGVDSGFYRHDRSDKSSFIVGVSYTYMSANSVDFDRIQAISIYPQLSLFAGPDSWISSLLPGRGRPFFYVRALGPSYISANRLGERQQANNFAFQAQIGAGARFDLRDGRTANVSVSWKHFSNANLFSPNDGIDLPIVLNFGVEF
jgi:opacity protein-like surface antigen